MSDQLVYLQAWINNAKTGNESAVTLLRQLCSRAAEEAPTEDLIILAECLFQIGVRDGRRNIERN